MLFLPDFSGRNEREQTISDSLYFYGKEKELIGECMFSNQVKRY